MNDIERGEQARRLLEVAAAAARDELGAPDWLDDDDVCAVIVQACAVGVVDALDRHPDFATGFMAGRYRLDHHVGGVNLIELEDETPPAA